MRYAQQGADCIQFLSASQEGPDLSNPQSGPEAALHRGALRDQGAVRDQRVLSGVLPRVLSRVLFLLFTAERTPESTLGSTPESTPMSEFRALSLI